MITAAPPQTPLEHLYSIFGDVVLIPVEPKPKKPVNAGWNTVTFADTQNAAYQGGLEAAAASGGNIGLVLGPASGGVAAIDIDSDVLADQFLQLNPFLGDTPRTRGRRGCQFFIRLSPGCSYPNSKAVYALKDANGQKYGEWRCGGGGLGAQLESITSGATHPGRHLSLRTKSIPRSKRLNPSLSAISAVSNPMPKTLFTPDPGWDCENYDVFGWPRTTFDKLEGREWIHLPHRAITCRNPLPAPGRWWIAPVIGPLPRIIRPKLRLCGHFSADFQNERSNMELQMTPLALGMTSAQLEQTVKHFSR